MSFLYCLARFPRILVNMRNQQWRCDCSSIMKCRMFRKLLFGSLASCQGRSHPPSSPIAQKFVFFRFCLQLSFISIMVESSPAFTTPYPTISTTTTTFSNPSPLNHGFSFIPKGTPLAIGTPDCLSCCPTQNYCLRFWWSENNCCQSYSCPCSTGQRCQDSRLRWSPREGFRYVFSAFHFENL